MGARRGALIAARCSGVAGNHRFLRFWAGQQCSFVGDGMYQVAIAWLVYRMTHSPADMGLVLALGSVPQVLALSVAGLAADRFPRRFVVTAADAAAAVAAAALGGAAASGHASLPVLCGGSVLLGLASALHAPSSRAIVADLVPADHLGEANGLFGAAASVARVIGPVLGGVLVVGDSASAALLADAGSFAIAAAATLSTGPARSAGHPGARQKTKRDQATDRGMRVGLQYVRHRRWLLAIMVASGMVNFAALAPFTVLVPKQAGAGHAAASLLGLVYSVEAAAAVGSAMLLSGASRGRSPLRAMWLLAALIGVGVGVTGLAPASAALLPGAALVGTGLSFSIIENTLLQSRVDPAVLGRVYAANVTASYAPGPLGYLLAGVLAAKLGAGPVLLLGGALTVGSVGLVGAWSTGAPEDRPAGVVTVAGRHGKESVG